MVIELTCNVLGGQTIQEDEDNDKEQNMDILVSFWIMGSID